MNKGLNKFNKSPTKFWQKKFFLSRVVIAALLIAVSFSLVWIFLKEEKDVPIGVSGLLLSNRDSVMKMKFLEPPVFDKNEKSLLDSQTDDNRDDRFPPAGNQRHQGSCVAFTLSYNLISYYEKSLNNYSYESMFGFIDYSKVYSPTFVHNSIIYSRPSPNCQSGISFLSAFKLIEAKGCCTWEQFPYVGDPICDRAPLENDIKQARELTGYKFYRVKKDFVRFKDFLDSDYPLIVGLFTSKKMVQEGYEAGKVSKPYFWNPRQNDTEEYHSILCVSFDEKKDAFLLLNSWGKEWGNNGYCYVQRKVFMSRVREVYVATLNRPKLSDQKVQLLQFQEPYFQKEFKGTIMEDSIITQNLAKELDSLLFLDLINLKSLKNKSEKQIQTINELEKYLNN